MQGRHLHSWQALDTNNHDEFLNTLDIAIDLCDPKNHAFNIQSLHNTGAVLGKQPGAHVAVLPPSPENASANHTRLMMMKGLISLVVAQATISYGVAF